MRRCWTAGVHRFQTRSISAPEIAGIAARRHFASKLPIGLPAQLSRRSSCRAILTGDVVAKIVFREAIRMCAMLVRS